MTLSNHVDYKIATIPVPYFQEMQAANFTLQNEYEARRKSIAERLGANALEKEGLQSVLLRAFTYDMNVQTLQYTRCRNDNYVIV